MTPEQPKVPSLREAAKAVIAHFDARTFSVNDPLCAVLCDMDRALAADAEERKEIVEFVRDVATNWDHDGDAHRYGTSCRVCDAAALFKKLEARDA